MDKKRFVECLVFRCISLISFSFILLNYSYAQCTAQGPLSPASMVNNNAIGAIAFANPTRSATSNDQHATASATAVLFNANSNYLWVTNFGFSAPANSSVCGIVVEVERRATGINLLASVEDHEVRIIKNGAIAGINHATNTNWTGTDTYVTYGGQTDDWGAALTPSDVNASDFGIAISARIQGLAAVFPVARIDHIRVTVYWNILVPITLSELSVTDQENGTHLLEWFSEASIGTKGSFEIQNSDNARDWNTISTLALQQNNEKEIYQFAVSSVVPGKNYYRILMTTNSGTTLQTKVVKASSVIKSSLKIFPNPSSDFITVKIPGIKKISVMTINGQPVDVPRQSLDANTIRLDVRSIANGWYVIASENMRKLIKVER